MFAVLYIADFALHAVLRTEPGSAAQAAALFAQSRQKSIVLEANAAARRAGIEPGMTAPQAVARCPTLLIRTPQPAVQAEARAALLAVGFTLSPAIEDTAPGVCTADLKGGSTSPETLAAAALARLDHLGLPATAGIARTPLLALYAAKVGSGVPPEPPTATDDVSRWTKPSLPAADDFFQLVAEHPPEASAHRPDRLAEAPAPYHAHHGRVRTVIDEKSFLAPLPLASAEPPPELAPVFFAWGVHTLGELTALPRDDIVRRFGAAGLALWQRATGGGTRPLHLVVPATGFSVALELESAVETLEPLLFLIRRLLDRLTLELRAGQHVAAAIDFTIRLESDARHTRNFRLPEPTADAEILFRTLHTHLESLRTDAAIVALELNLVPTRPLVRQHGIFDTGLRDPHGFAETLARVAALVHAERVGTPQREDTHRPDAVKLVTPAPVVPPPAEAPVHAPHGLPLRRFRPPLPATLEFAAPARQPVYVHTDRFHGAITDLRGPWRSSGDWWQGDRAWQRIEYDIAIAGGGLYRLLRVDEAWFIEGEYD
ncbi:DNA polymerase Y family protein [Horticoccus sp. 23ND18S-11]|uniref:DNA polymerase Y family protein n=1 Tax=Horticoccus sp. 23ND18S-11 TaxID=3391832 RepID=UPI0039C9320A